MTVFATGGRERTMDFQVGDVGYVLKTLPRSIQNTGHRPEIPGDVQEQLLSGPCTLGMAHPSSTGVGAGHLGIDEATLDARPKDEVVVMPK
jgi:oxalate decarboxylase